MIVAAPPPAFAAHVSRVTRRELRSSYRAGCPVPPSQLRRVRLRYWGFDRAPHWGVLVVNVSATDAIVRAFSRLYDGRFPIRRMQPIDDFGGSDARSMAADNTSAFNCRRAVVSGPPQWSVHAYGLAVDVNPVENPYLDGARVLPAAGRRYLDRSRVRRGMAVAGGTLVSAFASVGWKWGVRFGDYQHFSATGG